MTFLDAPVTKLPILEFKAGALNSFDEIIFTGGEPLLFIDHIIDLAGYVRMDQETILYTARPRYDDYDMARLLRLIDGLTISLHEVKDVDRVQKFFRFLEGQSYVPVNIRLNVFSGISVDNLQIPKPYKVSINHKQWIEGCPLPEHEQLFILDPLLEEYERIN